MAALMKVKAFFPLSRSKEMQGAFSGLRNSAVSRRILFLAAVGCHTRMWLGVFSFSSDWESVLCTLCKSFLIFYGFFLLLRRMGESN